MRKCVAVGCKTGYKTCSEKVHCFVIPNDKNIIRLWQIAIFRDDIKLKPGDAICEKYFDPQDIIREKITCAPDGVTILGKVSTLFTFSIRLHLNILFVSNKKISKNKKNLYKSFDDNTNVSNIDVNSVVYFYSTVVKSL